MTCSRSTGGMFGNGSGFRPTQVEFDDRDLDVRAAQRQCQDGGAGRPGSVNGGVVPVHPSTDVGQDLLGPRLEVAPPGRTDVEQQVAVLGHRVDQQPDHLAGVNTQRARIRRGLTQNDAVGRTVREHQGIALAIRDRQPSLAQARIAVHIAGVEDWIRQALVEPL